MKYLFLLPFLLIGCSTAPTNTVAPPETTTAPVVSVDPVSCTKYDRVPLFGVWVTKNCRDTRARLLASTSTLPTTGTCTIESGSWIDPYTDSVFTLASSLQIDHLVPLKEAYESGAYAWTYAQRKAYANDSTLLIPASVHQNTSKSARDAAEWLPVKNVAAYCIKWAQVKRKYNLSADSLEIVTLRKYVSESDLPKMATEVTCEGE